MIRHVVWDWNGTLLDDVEHAMVALNGLLDERGITRIDRAHYREHFGFPVRDFYVRLGFDFSSDVFETVSERFIANYRAAAREAVTHPGALETVVELQRLGVAQSVLSALEITLLSAMLQTYGLTPYLTHVRGLSDLHAASKVALGIELMRVLSQDLEPHQVLFVGDTLHDYETAAAMGCEVLLFSGGHQTPERLQRSGARLIHSLSEVVDFVRRSACSV